LDANLQTVLELLAVPGEPGKEGRIAERLRGKLLEMGVPEDCIRHDAAQEQSECGGEVGNLIVRLDGRGQGQRRMLSTHMDTVPIAVGSQPRIEGQKIVNDAAGKALGADARAGCAALLAAARALTEKAGEHPPWTFVFFIQEEVGLVGSRGLDVGLLGEPLPAMCFNFDGAGPHEIVNEVTGAERLNIRIEGVAAHTQHTRAGISAVLIAAEALAQLQQEGWNGVIERPEGRGTANLGVIRGGSGSNVIMPDLYGLAEGRSFDGAFMKRIIEEWKRAFTEAVERANEENPEAKGRASVSFTPGPVYQPYALPEDAPVVREAQAAVEACGLEPRLCKDPGGVDSNNIVAKGIPSVSLGFGGRRAHTPDEWLSVPEFLKACQLAVELVAGE